MFVSDRHTLHLPLIWMVTGFTSNVYLNAGFWSGHSILNLYCEPSTCTSLNVVVQLYFVRFPLSSAELMMVTGDLSSCHIGSHPEVSLCLCWSSKVKEQGTVTQDPLSVVTFPGIMATVRAGLHPAPLKQDIDKTKDSIDP